MDTDESRFSEDILLLSPPAVEMMSSFFVCIYIYIYVYAIRLSQSLPQNDGMEIRKLVTVARGS